MSAYFLKLCWKNVWRNRRRTLLTAGAIGTGVMALVTLHNYYDGFHEQVIHNAIRYHSGHLVVGAPRFQTTGNPSRFIRDTRSIQRRLGREKAIKASSPRVLIQGLLSSPRGSANVLFTGVEPRSERRITRFAGSVTHGKYFEKRGTGTILVGRRLAQLLGLQVGSKVVALTQGVDGSIGNELFHVEGIFETQSEIDKSVTFLRIDDARKLASLPRHGAHQIAAVLHRQADLPDVLETLREDIPRKRAEVLGWMDIQRPLLGLIELNKSVNRLLMIVILFIAAMGIANSILMSILERTREFGVMMAVGTTRGEIVWMVVVETLLLAAVGVTLGNFLGIGLTQFFHWNGFDLKWLTDQQIVVQGTILQTVSYPTVHLHHSVTITAAILALALGASLVPIRHIARLSAVKALRAN